MARWLRGIRGHPDIRRLAEEIPVVCSDWFADGLRLSHVRVDTMGATVMALGHLLDHGRRRIMIPSSSVNKGKDGFPDSTDDEAIRLTRLARNNHDFIAERYPVASNTLKTRRGQQEKARPVRAAPAHRHYRGIHAFRPLRFFSTFFWSMGWWALFLAGCALALATGLLTEDVWIEFWWWKFVPFAVTLGVIRTVWITWGGVRDAIRLFRDLAKERADVHDDGFVGEARPAEAADESS